MEVAQIELPVSMASITNQVYDADTKSIDLTILQSNGESVIFSLDVAELVNVYTSSKLMYFIGIIIVPAILFP